jgi:formiminotetrahydrofolate cyclodeaminase
MMFESYSLKTFTERTAAPAAVPGGGSVSALAGTLAAALTAMVAGLTLKKETYAAIAPRMQALQHEAASLQTGLLAAVDRDAQSYQAVLAAMRLPRGSDTERRARDAAIQKAFIGASEVPMQVAELALQVSHLALEVARDGNPDMITDAGVSALMARSAVLGALMNVRINLKTIKDPDLVAHLDRKIHRIKTQVIENEQEMLALFSI